MQVSTKVPYFMCYLVTTCWGSSPNPENQRIPSCDGYPLKCCFMNSPPLRNGFFASCLYGLAELQGIRPQTKLLERPDPLHSSSSSASAVVAVGQAEDQGSDGNEGEHQKDNQEANHAAACGLDGLRGLGRLGAQLEGGLCGCCSRNHNSRGSCGRFCVDHGSFGGGRSSFHCGAGEYLGIHKHRLLGRIIDFFRDGGHGLRDGFGLNHGDGLINAGGPELNAVVECLLQLADGLGGPGVGGGVEDGAVGIPHGIGIKPREVAQTVNFLQIGAIAEAVFAELFEGGGQIDGRQSIAGGEGIHADGNQGIAELDIFQLVIILEGTGTDIGNAVGNHNAGDGGFVCLPGCPVGEIIHFSLTGDIQDISVYRPGDGISTGGPGVFCQHSRHGKHDQNGQKEGKNFTHRCCSFQI